MTSIFISYRREDSRHQTGRLYDRLVAHFGSEHVFKDVDSIPLGSDFREVLTERVAGCDVFLAVIGDTWLSIAGKSGNRRLDDPGDSVRIEIEAALSRKIPVIPVLVGNSSVPPAEELPESLRGLSFRNGLPVRPDPDFHHDMDRLIRGIEDGVSALRERSTRRGPETQGPEARKSADKTSSIDPRAVPPRVRAGHRDEPKAESAPKRPEAQTPPPIAPTRIDEEGSSSVGAEVAGSPNGRIWRVGLSALALVVAVLAAVIIIPRLGPSRDGTSQKVPPPTTETTPSVNPTAVKSADLPKPQPTAPNEPSKLITNSIGVKLVAGEEQDDNGLKMKFCWCPPGTFRMGSPPNEEGHRETEGPVQVTLSRGFWMGKYEVTQGQWRTVMGTSLAEQQAKAKPAGPLFTDIVGEGPTHPMNFVKYAEVEEFCRKLTAMERAADRLPTGWEYRLPTEAQWEYACRAGGEGVYGFGDDVARLGDFAWFKDNSGGRTHPVGEKSANAFGLHDTQGNVFEWCSDGYGVTLPGGLDPVGPSSAPYRVIRGGSWPDDPGGCRPAYRSPGMPNARGSIIGFRVAAVQSG
jgi:formylglycine-generating enzyme required for sulfatase activity